MSAGSVVLKPREMIFRGGLVSAIPEEQGIYVLLRDTLTDIWIRLWF